MRMSEDAERFHRRARECRNLVPRATDLDIRDLLARLANELDAEAKHIDDEEKRGLDVSETRLFVSKPRGFDAGLD
jgi:hypothetical protein